MAMTTETFSILHSSNILIHVLAGSLALLTGCVAILAKKGKKIHNQYGLIFLFLLGIAILTGLFGVFIFKRNSFLLVITVLSGYMGFSGYRILQTKSNKPRFMDIIVAVLAVLAVSYFIAYFKSAGMIWSPGIIYSTVGYLIFAVSYDLLRYLLPTSLYTKFWLHEHILKMISAWSGLLSAFSGTVFPQYQPYSQFLPSVFGSIMAILFMLQLYNKQKKIRTGPSPQYLS